MEKAPNTGHEIGGKRSYLNKFVQRYVLPASVVVAIGLLAKWYEEATAIPENAIEANSELQVVADKVYTVLEQIEALDPILENQEGGEFQSTMFTNVEQISRDINVENHFRDVLMSHNEHMVAVSISDPKNSVSEDTSWSDTGSVLLLTDIDHAMDSTRTFSVMYGKNLLSENYLVPAFSKIVPFDQVDQDLLSEIKEDHGKSSEFVDYLNFYYDSVESVWKVSKDSQGLNSLDEENSLDEYNIQYNLEDILPELELYVQHLNNLNG